MIKEVKGVLLRVFYFWDFRKYIYDLIFLNILKYLMKIRLLCVFICIVLSNIYCLFYRKWNYWLVISIDIFLNMYVFFFIVKVILFIK